MPIQFTNQGHTDKTKVSLFSLLAFIKDFARSNSAEAKRNPRGAHDRIRPALLGSLAQQHHIIFGHFDVHLDGSLHLLINRGFDVNSQHYSCYSS